MGNMNLDISDEIENKLRKRAAEKFGFKKGNLSKAVEEAINKWADEK